MESIGNKLIDVNSTLTKYIECLQYFVCTGLHVLYAYKHVPEAMNKCLIWMLVCGVVLIAVQVFVKHDIIQQTIVVTLVTCTIYVVGQWVHTMEFGITVYLVMCIMIAWLQNPILSVISTIEGILAMILAYVFARDIVLEKVTDTFYLTITIIGSLAMICISYMAIFYHKQMLLSEQRNESLIKAQQSKDIFFANMSHELRTPMNAVVGMSELILREQELPDTVRENATAIRNSGNNLLAIINDILDFSKMEFGKIEIAQEAYSLSSVMNDVVSMAMVRKGKKHIEILVDCQPDMPQLLIGDEVRIRQIIINLMGNAVKFTREGRVKLTIQTENTESGVMLKVSVSDTGIGIKEEELGGLFTSYVRLDTKKNSDVEGTGLGLAITKRLIEGMNGELSVQSTYGKGSVFSFMIPQGVADPTPLVHLKYPKESYYVLLVPDFKRIKTPYVRNEYQQLLERLIEQFGVRGRLIPNEKLLQKEIISILERDPEAAYTHIFISKYEYQRNAELYDRLAEEIHICVITDREKTFRSGENIRIIYMPMYLLTMAAILNGESVTGLTKDKSNRRIQFTAIGCRVLAVDDNQVNLQVIKGLLKAYQIRTDTVESAQEALEEIKHTQYDLILMDHMMPVMDGIEAVDEIRKNPEIYDQDVPIIALTANAVNGARNTFLKHGFQDFIAKPIEISVLERTLLQWLPEEKVQKAKESNDENAGQPAKRKSAYGFQAIDEFLGLSYFSNQKSDYEDILKIFRENGIEKISVLQTAYEAKDWKTYLIHVHALKSTALNIGAAQLSMLAKELEEAAREEHTDEIEQKHETMLQQYRLVLDDIGTIL